MNKKSIFKIGTLFCFFFIPVFTTMAQGYELLAKIPTITSPTPSFVEFAKGIFVAGVGLAIIAAVIMIIIGALGYVMAAVPSAKSEGKTKMTQALLGLMLLLISTVILLTINPDLLRAGLNLAKLPPPLGNSGSGSGSGNNPQVGNYCFVDNQTGQVEQCLTEAGCQARLLQEGGTKGSCVYQPTPTTGGEKTNTTDAANRALLNPGVKVVDRSGAGNPTSLAGMQPGTIAEINAIQSGCNCTVTVTSGTDGTHSTSNSNYTHANGYKVDIQRTTETDAYIKSIANKTQTQVDWGGVPADVYVSKTNPNITYALEPTVLDVQVKQ